MARIFISYSRVDINFVKQLYDLLQRMRPNWHIWYDQAPHGLLGGDSWWDEIMNAVAKSDIFIYVLTNDSVQSAYCQAEFEEARRLQKRIITIQARDRTQLKGNLSEIQFVDMKDGVHDGIAVAKLSGALDRQATQIKKRRALWRPQTAKPADEPTPQPRPDDSPDIDTPTLMIDIPSNIAEEESSTQPSTWKKQGWVIGLVVIIIMMMALAIMINNMGNPADDITPTPTHPIIAQDATELPIPLIVGTLDAQATIEQATANVEATISQRATDYAQMTQESINQTATATQWTNTPTPDITASIVAFRTEQAATVTQAWIDSWTATPTNTYTPTATHTYTPSPTPTPNATATLIAFRPQTNDDWTPIEREFDGVPMVLVPAGCFMMGSDGGESDESPVHEQCFDEPFWIDQYEVTQAQFARLEGVKANNNWFTGDNRPVESITWFEARDFCELRGGRLPTEAEWEYAARGVESWVYPWGNEWNANNAVWNRSSEQGTADVGSIPAGASWIGAYDMSGNVWEWTSSLYESYQYDESDGRERDTGNSTDVRRVLRGGSWVSITDSLRAPYRGRSFPNIRDSDDGVRCVLSVG